MKKIIIFIAFFPFFSFIVTAQKVNNYDGWAQKRNPLNFSTVEFQGPALELSYRELPTTPFTREWGSLLSLQWKAKKNFCFGVFVGGSIIKVNDLVEKPGINHLGRVTREGLFFNFQNNKKNFFYFGTSARVGHLWQLRPADGIPRGFHRVESEIQLSAGVRILGGESMVTPRIDFGFSHLARGGPYGGLKPSIGVSIFYTGR